MGWGSDKEEVHVHRWKREATIYAAPVAADDMVKLSEKLELYGSSEELTQELLQGKTTILFTCEDTSCGETREEYFVGKEVGPTFAMTGS